MDNISIDKFYGLAHRMRRLLTQYSEINDITKQEFLLMQLTNRLNTENKKVTTALLSKRLLVSKSAVSQMINGLEDRCFLMRTTDKTDRRKPVIELTETGTRVLINAEDSLHRSISSVFDMMGIDKTASLLSLMEELLDLYESAPKLKEEKF